MSAIRKLFERAKEHENKIDIRVRRMWRKDNISKNFGIGVFGIVWDIQNVLQILRRIFCHTLSKNVMGP